MTRKAIMAAGVMLVAVANGVVTQRAIGDGLVTAVTQENLGKQPFAFKMEVERYQKGRPAAFRIEIKPKEGGLSPFLSGKLSIRDEQGEIADVFVRGHRKDNVVRYTFMAAPRIVDRTEFAFFNEAHDGDTPMPGFDAYQIPLRLFLDRGKLASSRTREAVYFCSGKGELTAADLAAHPSVVAANEFNEVKAAAKELVTIWIDKNAIEDVDLEWLHKPPQKYYPIVVVGYCDALYSFRDALSGFGIEGPGVDWEKFTLSPGFSVWMVTSQTATGGGGSIMRGYEDAPTVAGILKITTPLLEKSMASDTVPWGKASNGLQCRLSPNTQTATVWQGANPDAIRIHLNYDVRNAGDRALRFSPTGTPLWWPSVFQVTGSDGKKVGYTGIESKSPPPAPPVELAPGEILRCKVRLHYNFTRPGKYLVRTKKESKPDGPEMMAYYGNDAAKARQNPDNVWTGSLMSNTVTVEIVAGKNPEQTLLPGSHLTLAEAVVDAVHGKKRWGPASNGIQAGIRCKAINLKPEPEAVLVCSVRNVGTKPVRLPCRFRSIKVTKNGKIYPYCGPKVMPPPPPRVESFIELAPGAVDSAEVRILAVNRGLKDFRGAEKTLQQCGMYLDHMLGKPDTLDRRTITGFSFSKMGKDDYKAEDLLRDFHDTKRLFAGLDGAVTAIAQHGNLADARALAGCLRDDSNTQVSDFNARVIQAIQQLGGPKHPYKWLHGNRIKDADLPKQNHDAIEAYRAWAREASGTGYMRDRHAFHVSRLTVHVVPAPERQDPGRGYSVVSCPRRRSSITRDDRTALRERMRRTTNDS